MRPWPALLLFASACSDEGDAATPEAAGSLPAATSPESGASGEEPAYVFQDVTEVSGLAGFRQRSGSPDKPFIVETIGAGVALVDVDRDGDLDVYLTNGSSFGVDPEDAPRDALYRNDGTGRFRDDTVASGLGDRNWTSGVRVADYDADGWPDLYLTNYGPNVLYRNRGDGTFEDVTERTGVGDPGYGTGACFLDYDQDGDLDLYVANYLDFDEERMLRERPSVSYKGYDVMKGPRGLPEQHDSFYRNEDGVFRDVSEEVGIREQPYFGFQCVAFDSNRDGALDVYVANDSVENLLWRSVETENGRRFENAALLSGLALSMSGKPQAGMGIALGDFDGDLIADVYVTNFADDYFTLYRGTARNFFVDATHRLRLADVTKPSLGWGCGFEDFDSDGDLEIFVVNGHVYPQVDQFEVGSSYRQRNLLFEYDGKAFRIPAGAGGPGFQVEKVSRGAAVGDVDGDGDLDVLVGNLDDAPTLLRNDTPGGNWLKLEVVGAGANRDAVGARVVVTAGSLRQLRLVSTGGSFLSSSSPRLHVGLGAAERAHAVEITWPDGHTETTRDVPAGAVLRIEEGGPGEAARFRVLALDGSERNGD